MCIRDRWQSARLPVDLGHQTRRAAETRRSAAKRATTTAGRKPPTTRQWDERCEHVAEAPSLRPSSQAQLDTLLASCASPCRRKRRWPLQESAATGLPGEVYWSALGRPLPTADVGYPVAQLGGHLPGSEIAHPAVAGRPIPARRRAPKLSDDRPGSFTFRIHEAAVRGQRRSAISCRSRQAASLHPIAEILPRSQLPVGHQKLAQYGWQQPRLRPDAVGCRRHRPSAWDRPVRRFPATRSGGSLRFR